MRKPNINVAGEWEVTPKELAGLFLGKKWGYDLGNGKVEIPKEEHIENMIGGLVEDLADMKSSVGEWKRRGRFLVYRDPEARGSFDVYLNVGFAWSPDLMTDEEKAMFEEDDNE